MSNVTAASHVNAATTTTIASTIPNPYLYYTLKQPTGFVLARAVKGTNGQPLGSLQTVASFPNEFGRSNADSVFTMQISPDGRYLAIDGASDHGEQVWVYDTQQRTLSLRPAAVLGNFLHWLPTGNGHTFLYRPMFPLGPSAPFDGNTWNPGLWEIDASTGLHKNIDVHVPSAFLVDAAPSPDGSRVIYSTTIGVGMGSDTWIMNSNGSARSHLFSTPPGAQSIPALFTWSPNGNNIAYEMLSDSSTPFLPAGLWLMNSSGKQQQRLADADGGHGYAPIWSPDSTKIAFVARTNVSNRLANTSAQALQTAIAVVDIRTNRSWIVASASSTGMQMNINPVWSAHSSSVTFTSANATNQVLGGTPRYWSANATTPTMHPAITPLTPALSHVVAAG